MRTIWWVGRPDRFQEQWRLYEMEDHGVGECFGHHRVRFLGEGNIFVVPFDELYREEAAARSMYERNLALEALAGRRVNAQQ